MTDAVNLTLLLVILLLGTRRFNLGLVMLFSAVLLGTIQPLPIERILAVLFTGAVNKSTINLLAVLFLIMLLERIMRKHRLIQNMITALGNILRDYRILAGTLPAIIGILPSVGGAVFSAPMVQEVSKHSLLNPEQKTFINYWFRHPWEFFSPLYPAVIFASEALKLPLDTLILIHLPLAVFMWTLGILFGLRPALSAPETAPQTKFSRESLIHITAGLLPFTLILGAVAFLKIPLVLILAFTMVFFFIYYRYKVKEILELTRKSIVPGTLLIIIGLMVFKEMLQATGITGRLPSNLDLLGVPPAAAVMMVPLLIGLLSGSIGGTAAISLPVLAGLISGNTYLEVLAYTSCVAGCLISPCHPCFILTVDYFNADLFKVLKQMLLPVLLLLLFSAGWGTLVNRLFLPYFLR